MHTDLRILIVDDSASDANSAQEEIRRSGLPCSTLRVDSLETFRASLWRFRPSLILTEANLSGMDALAAVRLARELDPHQPVIVLARSMTLGRAVEFMKEGAGDCLDKFDLSALGPAILSVLSRRAELEAADSRRIYLQSAADATPDAICIKDLEGRYLFANQAFLDMAGKEEKEVIGRDDHAFFPPDEARAIMEFDRQVSAGGVNQTFEEILTTAAAGRRTYLSAKGPIRDRSRRVTALFSVARDITDRKRDEDRLRNLSYIVEQSPVAVVVTGLDGSITYVNRKFTEVTGYDLDEARGRNPRILKSGETPADAYQDLWRTISAGGTWQGEFHNKRKNGELFWERATLTGLRDESGRLTHFVAIKEDITARKELEARLFQSQKMEGIGQLAGGVAHDFNNILNVILGYGELALARLPDHGPLRRYLEEMRKSANRAAGLTRQLLAFSRQQVLRPIIVDVNEAIREMQAMLRRLVPESVEFHLSLAENLPPILADVSQCEQVLLNLVVNAVDAMPGGGRLQVETRLHLAGPDDPKPGHGAAPGAYVMLAIRDNGRGIPAEIQERIFEPFFTTKAIGRGTGLGLATVYGIVKQSGGYIDLESAPERGSCFEIYFPAAVADSAAPRPAEAGPAEASGSETILLVEDDAALRTMVSEVLRASGYRVLEAESGEAALAEAGERLDSIDLLLTDVIMPGLPGRKVAERLRERRPSLPVLYMSGYPSSILAPHGILDAGIDFIQKPLRPAELKLRVREILDRESGRAASERVA